MSDVPSKAVSPDALKKQNEALKKMQALLATIGTKESALKSEAAKLEQSLAKEKDD
jgi:hypothetical protein